MHEQPHRIRLSSHCADCSYCRAHLGLRHQGLTSPNVRSSSSLGFMVTLAELQQETWWNREFVPPTMQLLISRLRVSFQVPNSSVGAKGDENHLRGYHRSRNWILNSAYCTDRSYSVIETPGNRSGGNGDWLCAIDITIPRDQLIPMCQRLDAAVRSGSLEKVTEWYGNDDGDNRVDGYNNIRNIVATSDDSHLWHCHISLDRGRAGELHDDLYEVLIGEGNDVATAQETWDYDIVRGEGSYHADNALWDARQNALAANQRLAGVAPIPAIDNVARQVAALNVKVDQILTLLSSGVPVPGEVTLTDASVQEVAEAVADEQHERQAE